MRITHVHVRPLRDKVVQHLGLAVIRRKMDRSSAIYFVVYVDTLEKQNLLDLL